MVTVVRPPFYVPRPADESYWSGAPAKSAVVALLTKQKMFGAGGQVPAKQWRYDDNVGEAYWSGAPVKSPIIAFLTKQKVYGAGGQVPTSQRRFDHDAGEAYWSGAPVKSPIIAFLTKQKVYGAGGQVPTTLRRFDHDAGETFWQGSPISNELLVPILTAAGQVKANRWRFDHDDAAVWPGAPVVSATIRMGASSGVPVTAIRPRYDGDDFSAWFPLANRNLLTATAITAGPFLAPRASLHSDDAAVWSGGAIRSATIQLLTVQKIYGAGGQVAASPGRIGYDHADVWLAPANRNLLTATALANPLLAPRWNFAADDSSSWQSRFQRSIALPAPPIPNRRWTFLTADELPAWQLTRQRNGALLAPVGAPFLSGTWRFGLPEEQPWKFFHRDATLAMLTAAVPFFARRQSRDADDPAPWQSARAKNAPLLAVSFAVPFTAGYRRFHGLYDEPAGWLSAPRSSAALFYLPAFVLSPRLVNASGEVRNAAPVAAARIVYVVEAGREADVPAEDRST